MRRPTPRPLAVPPGPQGVTMVAASLRGVLAGDAPALALLPQAPGGTRQAASLAAALRLDAPLEMDGVALLLATSGSAGEPHGVLVSLPAFTAAVECGAAALGPPGLWLAALPMTGIGGLLTVARSLRAGSDPVALDAVGGAAPFTAEGFTAAARRTLARAESLGMPGYVSLVPTQLRRLIMQPASLDVLAGFAAVLVGGAWVPASDRALARDRGVRIVETYGATETCGGVVYDGEPLPGVTVSFETVDTAEMTQVGPGRIVIAGPTLALGYRLRPDLTAASFTSAGYRSSDCGRRTLGRVSVEARLDQIVKVGGVKVSLTAVANALRTHPRIIDAVTDSEADPQWGAIPLAYVLTDGTVFDADALRTELNRIVADRLGMASQPRRIELVDHLPGHSGKPARPAVR